MPRGFESGLRYLAPALVLGLALLPAVEPIRGAPRPAAEFFLRIAANESSTARSCQGLGMAAGRSRPDPGNRRRLPGAASLPGVPLPGPELHSAPGLNAAFAWAHDVSDSRIATTSTRQYPLFGTDLSNRVQYLGTEQPHGGFEPPANCRQYLQLLDEGDYDYVVATKDRLEPGKPSYPPQAAWTKAAGAKTILKEPPTVVFELSSKLRLAGC